MTELDVLATADPAAAQMLREHGPAVLVWDSALFLGFFAATFSSMAWWASPLPPAEDSEESEISTGAGDERWMDFPRLHELCVSIAERIEADSPAPAQPDEPENPLYTRKELHAMFWRYWADGREPILAAVLSLGLMWPLTPLRLRALRMILLRR
jgi:hypothetical protein